MMLQDEARARHRAWHVITGDTAETDSYTRRCGCSADADDLCAGSASSDRHRRELLGAPPWTLRWGSPSAREERFAGQEPTKRVSGVGGRSSLPKAGSAPSAHRPITAPGLHRSRLSDYSVASQ